MKPSADSYRRQETKQSSKWKLKIVYVVMLNFHLKLKIFISQINNLKNLLQPNYA